MRRTHNHAPDELSLWNGGEEINEVEREFVRVVMNHDEIRVLAEQFLFVGLDLYLLLLLLQWFRRFGHRFAPRNSFHLL
jgi:hypothetical protein